MKLTTKGKFAVTALLDIALNSTKRGDPITLWAISKRQGISISYLEQLFVKLRKNGMVSSYKGPGGGYILAKELDKLNIYDIISAVDDNMDASRCGGMRNCQDNKQCLTHDLWEDLTTHVYKYLSKVTLLDLIIRHELKEDNIQRETQEIKFADTAKATY